LRILGSTLLWHGLVRAVIFWSTFAAGLAGLARIAPYSRWQHVSDVIREVSAGNIEHVSEKTFAFALSSGICQVAIAFALAFFVSHVVLLRAAVRGAKGSLGRSEGISSFAQAFDKISDRMEGNAVIRHGWRQFAATTIRESTSVRYTVRPQSFINLADARAELFGLKMMGSIPGYFVGLGLLLTFIGLVLALDKAAGSTAAGSAEAMTESLNELLAAATFKFSTSIAGLGASLVLALIFRTYQIWIEGAFDGFSRALERRMIFYPPQRIAEDSREILAAQRDQLKEINSERFFTRLGESAAPGIGRALTEALGPLAERLDRTAEELTRTSRSGADSLVQSFVERLDQGASREMQEVVGTLKGLRDALDRTQVNLSGSGQDFSTKLTEAAETIAKVFADASLTLGGSASGVAGTVDAAMAQVLHNLEAQSKGFGETLTSLQTQLAAQLQESAQRSLNAGEAAATASTLITRNAMDAVRTGIDEVISALREDIGGLASTLRSVSAALSGQTVQIETISARSRDTAEAFGKVASDVRSASQPLLTHSARVADSTDRMATSIADSVETLSATQQAADGIAARLSEHLEQIAHIWDQYELRFKSVDEDLGKAADRFHEEVSRHQEAMREFVKGVDDHTGNILGKINSAVGSLSDSVESLNETLEGFLQAMASREAAE
jgi:ABC-type transporter Mla subunit MlaD